MDEGWECCGIRYLRYIKPIENLSCSFLKGFLFQQIRSESTSFNYTRQDFKESSYLKGNKIKGLRTSKRGVNYQLINL